MQIPTLIPTLGTFETAQIRADYPSIEHLEAGNTASWLQERRDQLLSRARNIRSELNLAKLLTLGASAVGAICYATSPLAPIGALVAGVGYCWAIAQDLNESHQFCPLPFVRGDFLEFFAAMGDKEARDQYFAQSDAITELMLHLEPLDRYEFGMLQMHLHTLSDYLSQVEPGKKFHAYRWLFTWFCNLRGSFPDKETLAAHVATVSIDARLNPEIVAAIQNYQNQAESYLAHGLPVTQTCPLPPAAVEKLPSAPSANNQSPPVQPPSEAPSPQEPSAIDVPAIPVPPPKTASMRKAAEPGAPAPNLQQLLKLPMRERAIALHPNISSGYI